MRFAKIGINNKVIDIVVVAEEDCQDANGQFDENIGVEFLEKLTGWALWVASTPERFNGGKGSTWDEENKVFKVMQPHPSWTFNYSTGEWDPPIDYPSDYGTVKYNWNEDTQSWDTV